jgi:Glycosyl hydrolases family 2, sugar binding domain/Glycosyl hydrolases family 2
MIRIFKFSWLVLVLAGCSVRPGEIREKLSLAGEWRFRIDSLNEGIGNKWYNDLATETVKLPGSMAENGKGEDITIKTNWTGEIVDKSYFTDKKYEKYRQPGNIKIPFWLKPVKYYKGVAWYQKEVEIPSGWNKKNIVLFLERPHWESTVYINGKKAGIENSLAVPHQFDITGFLIPGKNLISIRIDNRVVIPVGINSHSITDHTQTNWNGIVGDISLIATSKVFIRNVKVYPDLKGGKAKIIVALSNKSGTSFNGEIDLLARSFNSDVSQKLKKTIVVSNTDSNDIQLITEFSMGKDVKEWSEFRPALYRLSVSLKGPEGETMDAQSVDFGMRDIKAKGTRFELNGRQIFLRGTLECCIFPLTGYPPTDIKSWLRVLRTFKEYGLNTVRFHSWCPPEAAFSAGDQLGMYFQIECSSWANSGTTIGDGSSIDEFIYKEGDRIINTYGNHPSFCMLAYGNEPAGSNQNAYLGKLLTYWKAEDTRRVYTSGAGWPAIPENDYNLTAEPRIQRWDEGLKSIINREAPQTMFNYHDIISKYTIPTVSHEIGQWCVYPDFKEIAKYTGVLKPTNFEIFRESLVENDMGDQAEDFLMASGKLQALCYKADIEAALRTPGFAGFHLLQLHDFPGQGTALVGVLNSFFESKGYITPEEFRMFCNQTVPLAKMQKMVYSNNESFKADIEIANFGEKPIEKAEIICQVTDESGNIIRKEIFTKDKIEVGNRIEIGLFQMDLADLTKAQKLTLEVIISGTPSKNKWDFWVYPANPEINNKNVLVTDKLDKDAEEALKNGGSVLLLNYGRIGKDKGAKVAIGFSTVFWNTAWTNNQPPHTLGILCDPKHPVFNDFPTEFHSNWQWWDPVSHSQAMIIDGFPKGLKPLIQPIDTWFENRRLALTFEARTYGGKLMVCSIDLKSITEDRLASKQLYISILNYMNSSAFNPQVEVGIKQIKELMAGLK